MRKGFSIATSFFLEYYKQTIWTIRFILIYFINDICYHLVLDHVIDILFMRFVVSEIESSIFIHITFMTSDSMLKFILVK